ncbi:MAG: cell division protein FtsL [Hyphomicrobium sp.]
MRLLNVAAFCFAVASAFLLYSLNYETRKLEAHIQAQERAAQKAKSDIAVLKAERSHLSRPERIDPLARQIGLMPPRADQLVSPDVASAVTTTAKEPLTLHRLAESE